MVTANFVIVVAVFVVVLIAVHVDVVVAVHDVMVAVVFVGALLIAAVVLAGWLGTS